MNETLFRHSSFWFLRFSKLLSHPTVRGSASGMTPLHVIAQPMETISSATIGVFNRMPATQESVGEFERGLYGLCIGTLSGPFIDANLRSYESHSLQFAKLL